MNLVVPGLAPGVDVLDPKRKDEHGRDKPGHDDVDRFR